MRNRLLWLAALFVGFAGPVHAQDTVTVSFPGGEIRLLGTVQLEPPPSCPECPPPPPFECPDGWNCIPPPEPSSEFVLLTGGQEIADTATVPTGRNDKWLEDAAGEWRTLGLGYNQNLAPGIDSVVFYDPDGRRNKERSYPYGVWNERGNWLVEAGETYTIIYEVWKATGEIVRDTVRITGNPTEPPVPPDTTPPEPGAPDSIRFVPMSPGDTINYWVTGYWDDLPYTAWLKVSVSDSVGTADLWQAYDPVGDCQYVEGPWVEQFVNVTEVTGSKFDPSFLFFPRYCGPPPEPPDTIAISTPQNLRTEDGNTIAGIAWDRVPEDGQCENATGHPANCPDVQGDEIYYRVTDVEYWPADLMETAGYSSTLMFDTLSAMASTHRSFKLRYPGPGDVIPDSLRFCVTAEAWDCPTCAGPGGVRSPGNLRGYNPVYYVPISEKACSGVLEVVP